MCVNQIKSAAKAAAKFIFDNTDLDYQIATKSVQYGFKMYGKLDSYEKSRFIKYLEEMITLCKANLSDAIVKEVSNG